MKKLMYMFETLAVLNPSALDEKELKDKKYHYYFIVSSPAKYVDDVYAKNDELAFLLNDGKGQFEVLMSHPDRDYRIENVTFRYKTPNDKRVALLSYDIKFNDGRTKSIIDGDFPAFGIYSLYEKKQRYKIEYIGQSYANDGHRTAQDRLSSHSTLTKILSDALNEGNKDIGLCLLGADISCIDNTCFLGKESPVISIGDVSSDITAHHVNLLEAYLINTFKPKYNKTYKAGNVPSQSHQAYKKVTNEDYDDISVRFGIRGCKHDYEFYTEQESIRIENGVLSNGSMKVFFKEANRVDDNNFMYSFMDI